MADKLLRWAFFIIGSALFLGLGLYAGELAGSAGLGLLGVDVLLVACDVWLFFVTLGGLL